MDNQIHNAIVSFIWGIADDCLRDLTSRTKKQTLKADFEAYLDGFSPNVQEILEKFKFRNQIDAEILGGGDREIHLSRYQPFPKASL